MGYYQILQARASKWTPLFIFLKNQNSHFITFSVSPQSSKLDNQNFDSPTIYQITIRKINFNSHFYTIQLFKIRFQKIKMLQKFKYCLYILLFLYLNQIDSQLQYLHALTQTNLYFFAYILSFEAFHEDPFELEAIVTVFLIQKYHNHSSNNLMNWAQPELQILPFPKQQDQHFKQMAIYDPKSLSACYSH